MLYDVRDYAQAYIQVFVQGETSRQFTHIHSAFKQNSRATP